jgi:hypothetical protein
MLILRSTLSPVSRIFDIHDVSGVGSTYVFGCLSVVIFTGVFKIGSDTSDRARLLSYHQGGTSVTITTSYKKTGTKATPETSCI